MNQYRVIGNLVGHDGFRANFIEDVAQPVNPEVIQVDEYVYTNEGKSGATEAAAYKARIRAKRTHYYWETHPRVFKVVDESEPPEDQRLRAEGAPTLPGME